MTKEEMRDKLKRSLKTKRFEHSEGVCAEAVRMAELFGADTEKAYIAGLLHDCAKCFSPDEEKEISQKYGYVPDLMTQVCHPVLHAPLGAVVAEHEYGVHDKEILDAIHYHTVARADMTLLDKIVYVADMTEPGRDYDGAERLRALAHKDIDEAFCEALSQSLIHNIKKGSIIHPNSLDAWNNMIINKKGEDL